MIDTLFSMQGRTVLVSGASSGIGLHVARTLAAAGASLALAARRKDRVEAAAAELQALGHCAKALYLDVTDAQRASHQPSMRQNRRSARLLMSSSTMPACYTPSPS